MLLSLKPTVFFFRIEHLYPDELDAFPYNVFGYMAPKLVIVTTPNADFNVVFPDYHEKKLRNRDHKFEWTRSEFEDWWVPIF